MVISRIVDALDLTTSETVIEIGPGHGELTSRLVAKAGRVIAIEFDRELAPVLKDRLGSFVNFSLIVSDALDVDYAKLISLTGNAAKIKLVANLPYNISTPILQRLISQRHLFSVLVLMFQREVVNRITAKPGKSERGYLTVLSEAAFERERLFDVPPAAFSPKPKVWSSVVRLVPKRPSFADEEGFRRFLSIAFAQKRKTLANNLKMFDSNAIEKIESCEIDPRRRAETLTLDEWENLYHQFT